MGAHTSYPLVIYHLVSLKNHFQFVTDEKFFGVIKELSNYEIYPNSENDNLPDHIQLAEKLNYKLAKMTKLLKELLKKIHEDFYEHPLILKNVVHILSISPYIKPEDEKRKEWVEEQWDRALTIHVVLPVTPQIGDYVELPLMRTSHSFSTDDKYTYGFVHDVMHTINGTIQVIYIKIYPFENIYNKWEEMKAEYENHQLRLRRLKYEKEIS